MKKAQRAKGQQKVFPDVESCARHDGVGKRLGVKSRCTTGGGRQHWRLVLWGKTAGEKYPRLARRRGDDEGKESYLLKPPNRRPAHKKPRGNASIS